jgi:hypothetical protein
MTVFVEFLERRERNWRRRGRAAPARRLAAGDPALPERRSMRHLGPSEPGAHVCPSGGDRPH